MSYRGHDDPQRSEWRRYDDRRERPPPPRAFTRESRDSPLGSLDRGGRRDPDHHQNDLEGLKIRISNSGRHADSAKMPLYEDLPDAREDSRHLTRRYDAPKESDGLKITVGNDRYRDSAERRFSERRIDDRQHISPSPDHRSRSHSVRSDSVRSKSPTPSRAADFARASFPDLDVDFKGPKIDMNVLNPQSLQQDEALKKAHDLELEFYKRLSSPFLVKEPPAPPVEKPFIPGVNLDMIDDEDAFLYGDSSEPTPKRSASPLSLPPPKKRGLFDEEPPVHAPVPQQKKMVFEYHDQEKPEPKREQSKKSKAQAKNLYEEKEAAKEDYDPTIENILKSIGFNFELSKQTQEKAKREREASFSVDEASSFMEGGIDMAALFQEKLKEAEEKAISESKQSSQTSYEEKARRYRQELIQKAKAEMEDRSKRKPSNLFEAEEEKLAAFTSTIDLSLPPISGPMKVERKTSRQDIRATPPSEDPDAEWERRRQEFLKKLQQPRLEETTTDKKRTVLPPKEPKRTVKAKEPESVKRIIQEKEQLARDYAEKEKRLKVLDKELERLRRQQNEMMRKKQRDRDGHRDPLLLANTKLQEDIALQIKALRQAADKGTNKEGDKYESLSSSDSEDFTEKKSKLAEAQKKKVFMKPKTNSAVVPAKQPEDEKRSFVKRMHYEYFDAGSHWCQQCNSVTNTIFDLFEHLHSKGHRSKMDLFSRPWASDKFKNEAPKAPGMKSVHAEIKGVEFMIPTQAYFCNLCKEFSGDSSSAEQHLKTAKHNEKYRQYVEENQFYEKRLALDRAAGMAGGKETKKVEKKKEKKDESLKKDEIKVERLSAHRENVQEANKRQLRVRTYSSISSSEEEDMEEEEEEEEEEDMRFIGPKENDDRSKINIKFTSKSALPAKKPLKDFVKKRQEKVLIGAKKQPVFFGKMRHATSKEKRETPVVKKDIGIFTQPTPKLVIPAMSPMPRVLVTSQLKASLTPPVNPLVINPPSIDIPLPPIAEPKLPSPELLPPGVDRPPAPPPPPLPISPPASKENGEKILQEENDVIEDAGSECELMDMGSDFEILDECDAD